MVALADTNFPSWTVVDLFPGRGSSSPHHKPDQDKSALFSQTLTIMTLEAIYKLILLLLLIHFLASKNLAKPGYRVTDSQSRLQ
jgi:hypothetical protein